jgi:hypothetical protein
LGQLSAWGIPAAHFGNSRNASGRQRPDIRGWTDDSTEVPSLVDETRQIGLFFLKSQERPFLPSSKLSQIEERFGYEFAVRSEAEC